MFKFFKRNPNGKAKSNGQQKKSSIQFVDIDGQPLAEGDRVQSLRYDLGECVIVAVEKGYDYESVETGERVSYLRMIDAATS